MYIFIAGSGYVGISWMPAITRRGVVPGASVCIERSVMFAINSTR